MPESRQKRNKEGVSAWIRQRQALQKSGLETIKDLVGALRGRGAIPPSLRKLPKADAIEILVDVGLSAIPFGHSLRREVLQCIDPNVVPSFQDVVRAYQSLSPKDVSKTAAPLLADNQNLLKEKKIKDPFASKKALARHPLTAPVFSEPRYVEVAQILRLGTAGIDKLRDKFASDALLLAADTAKIRKVAGISVSTAEKIKAVLCYELAFNVTAAVAHSLYEHYPEPSHFYYIPPREVRQSLLTTEPKATSDQVSLQEIQRWIQVVKDTHVDEVYLQDFLRDVAVPKKVRQALDKFGVATIADLRKPLPPKLAKKHAHSTNILEFLIKTRAVTDKNLITIIRAHVRLEKLSKKYESNKAFISTGIHTSTQIAAMPFAKLKRDYRSWASTKELLAIQRRAQREQLKVQAFTTWRNFSLIGPRLDKAIWFPRKPEEHAGFRQVMMLAGGSGPGAYQSSCECERCEAVFSPAAYLTALIRFIEHYFSTDENAFSPDPQRRGLDFLAERMYRPELKTLAMRCKVINAQIPQPEIARRVLLNYIITHTAGITLPPTAAAEQLEDLYDGYRRLDDDVFTNLLANRDNPPPFYLYGTQLNEYLTVLGTSLPDIHGVFADPEAPSMGLDRLAELLGISRPELDGITTTTIPSWAQMATVLGVTEADLMNAAGQSNRERLKTYFGLTAEEKREEGEFPDLLDEILGTPVFDSGATLADLAALDGDEKVDKVIRILKLAEAFGRTVRETVALLDLVAPPNLMLGQVEALFERSEMLFDLALEPSELARALTEPDAAQRKVAARLRISEETLARLVSVQDIDDVYLAWTLVRELRQLRIAVEEFVRLPDLLVGTDGSVDQLVTSLGVTPEELNTAIASPSDESISELLGLSIEDLTRLLGDFNIEYQAVYLRNPEEVDSIEALDLLYRPVRIARALRINIEELSALLTEGLMAEELDVNFPNRDQLLKTARHVAMAKTLGIRLSRVPDAITTSGDTDTLEGFLGVDDAWWIHYTDPTTPATERLALLAEALRIPAGELLALVEARATTYAGTEVTGPDWLNDDWRRCENIRRWTELAVLLGMSPRRFYEMVETHTPALSLGNIDTFYGVCVLAIERRYLEQINRENPNRTNPGEMISPLDWLATPQFSSVDSIEKVERIYRLASLAQSVDLTTTKLSEFNLWAWNGEVTSNEVNRVLDLINDRFDLEQRNKELEKPNNRILEQTRDALLRYAISSAVRPGDPEAPRTAKDLGNLLLIDLETATCTTTNLVLQAIESLQTFIQRVQTGLEQEQTDTGIPKELKTVLVEGNAEKWQAMEQDWRWYRQHVLWEAAQKVYLYPENYVLPQLRDNKTELFREFEDQLSQGEVTQELAEKAVKDYLEALRPLSALRVTGTVYDADKFTLHFFARSRVDSSKHYWRTLKSQVEWSAWQSVNVEINADRVFPILAHNRLYIFWIESEEEEEDVQKKYQHTLCFTYSGFDGKWAKTIKHKIAVDGNSGDDLGWLSNEKLQVHVFQSTSTDLGPPSPISASPEIDQNKPIVVKVKGFNGPWLRDFKISCSNTLLERVPLSALNYWQASYPYAIAEQPLEGYLTVEVGGNWRLAWFGKPIRRANQSSFHGDHSYTHYTASPQNGVNFLLVHQSGLKFLSYKYNDFVDTWTSPASLVPAILISSGAELEVLVLSNADGMTVDAAIEIGSNLYFFCSDQHRTLMIVARITPGRCGKKVEFSVCELSYGKHCPLLDALLQDGVNGLYEPSIQDAPISKDLNVVYAFSDKVIGQPARELEFCGPNKIYNWEIFFHIPYFIADALNQNRKFTQAAKWYEYIFNPYADPQPVDPAAPTPRVDVTWNFEPFRGEAIEQVQQVLNAADDLLAWRQDPFSPHAIARVRPGTYQKAVLLAYIDNLIDWADQDFTEDTRTSINVARNRYLLAEQLLDVGELEALPRCEPSEETLAVRLNEPLDLAAGAESAVEVQESICCIPESWLDEDTLQPIVTSSLVPRIEAGCVPENPIFESYWRHIQSNLRKIRSCRNIAGIQRILPMYDAAVDPMAVVRAVSAGADLGSLNLSSSASGIGPYRFSYLIERAKGLAQLVVQSGNALLLAIEKKESEELAFLRAQQELKLTKAQVHLRKLQVKEAESGVGLAKLQTKRAERQLETYQDWIAEGLNKYESAMILAYEVASAARIQAILAQEAKQIAQAATTAAAATWGAAAAGSGAAAWAVAAGMYTTASSIAVMAETAAQILAVFANFESRKREWELNKELALKDVAIAKQGETMAEDRVAIAEFEQQIAEMQAEFADQTLQFLKEKFTNRELYKWMVKILSKVLYGFYNLAYTTARMAQATMEFERNQAQNFISYTYWDSEKKGLLSGEQLLEDIMRMDQAYMERNHRKLEITKHISLGRLAPEALAQLQQTGKTLFATPMSWFDRDFPGHYQRIIKSVRLSVLALVGPGTNVNATLSTVSPSLVMLHPEDKTPTPVPRYQSVALSGATNASGLFELNYRDERYLPFEGCGVDVKWELEMPKPSNRFDFNTLVDIVMTFDYTALADFDYKQKVIDELGDRVGGMLPLTVRTMFPDGWYHFHNPVFEPEATQSNGNVPYTLRLTVTRAMFPPNEEQHELEGAALLFRLTDPAIRVPLKIRYTSENGELFELRRTTGADGYLSLESGLAGYSPFGEWRITIDRDRAPENLVARDADGYPRTENITQPPSERNLLDTEKITDVVLSLNYAARVVWPPT